MDGWMDRWIDRWVEDCLQQSTIMARFLKFKFLFIYKLNFKGGQFYKKTLNFDYFQK